MINKLREGEKEKDGAKFGQIKYGLNVTVRRFEAIAPGQTSRLKPWYLFRDEVDADDDDGGGGGGCGGVGGDVYSTLPYSHWPVAEIECILKQIDFTRKWRPDKPTISSSAAIDQ
ncbi:hypothetical protein TYRP_007130 [Tyrophagus putrescentiae]|nr:hypothetical protein TYRP_007130 [Tyrophagus putrescentiae]